MPSVDPPLEEQHETRSYHLTDAQMREVVRIQRGIRDGTAKFATDEEMASLWRSWGL